MNAESTLNLRRINSEISVCPQIQPSDIGAIKAAGFRSIICNRPDGEAADQPDYDAIRTAAGDAGLESRYIPIQPGVVSDKNTADFGAALREMPGPILAYCRSGTRSATLCAAQGIDVNAG